MSLPAIRIVDVQHNNKVVDMAGMTQTALGSLVFECEQLLSDLKDAEAIAED